jgi:mRNA-decapping enzyme subunit 2
MEDHDKMLRDFPQLGDILRDIDTRFILNLDEAMLRDLTVVFFKLQRAHWFYVDKFDAQIKQRVLPFVPLERFGRMVIEHSRLLSKYFPRETRERSYIEWKEYMRRIPRLGAIILNPQMTSALMIQPYGAKNRGWQFPRGKINADEGHCEAAAREVLEETGVDVSHLLREDRFIERRIDGTIHKLFIAYPLSESVATGTRTKKEIDAVGWVKLKDFPKWSGASPQDDHKRYYGVMPFVQPLKQWVKAHGTPQEESGQDDEAFREGEEVPAGRADAVNADTFGDGGGGGWSFDAMIAANRKLGYKSEFDDQGSSVAPLAAPPKKKTGLTNRWLPRPAEVLAAFDAAWRASI